MCVGYAQSLEASSAQAQGARSEADIWEHDGSPVLFGTGYRRRERDRLSIMACQGHRWQASNEKLRYHFHLCLREVVIEMLMPEYL